MLCCLLKLVDGSGDGVLRSGMVESDAEIIELRGGVHRGRDIYHFCVFCVRLGVR